MVLFVTGGNGAGKTTCLPLLRRLMPDVAWFDFDDACARGSTPTRWRQRATEEWLRVALEHQESGRDVGICGHAVMGEILAAPTAVHLEAMAVSLLDCDDVLRIDRLRSRGTRPGTQDTLNWSAWLRMHAEDPRWRPDVIRDDSEPWMLWQRWSEWQRGDPRWCVWRLDTSELGPEEVSGALVHWARTCKGDSSSACYELQRYWWEP